MRFFIFHLFAVIITLSTIILLHICRCGVQCRDSQRSEYIFASDSSEPACLAQLRLIADLNFVSFSVSLSRRTSFRFNQRIPGKERNQRPSRGDRLSYKVAAQNHYYHHHYDPLTSSTLPPWKFLRRQWISRSGLNISPSQVITCALPILFAARFRSH